MSTARALTSENKSSCGAALVEFSLVVGLLLTLILVFLDFAHYCLISTILTRSAQSALSLAVVLEPLQRDFLNVGNLTSSPDYVKFHAARREIIENAQTIPLNTLVSAPGVGGAVELTTFNAHDEHSGGMLTVSGLNAAVIRPSESWYSQLQGRIISHPGICSSTVDGSCTTPRESDATMRGMLRSFPIIVMIQARKRSFFPGWGDIPITGTAVGWVQEYPESPFEISDFLPTYSGGSGGGSGSDTGGDTSGPPSDTCEDQGKPRPDTCETWNDQACVCCDFDDQVCPDGEHWEPSMCGCTSCPYSYDGHDGTSQCPANTVFAGWECKCWCGTGHFCPPGSHAYGCLNENGNSVCESYGGSGTGGGTGPGS